MTLLESYSVKIPFSCHLFRGSLVSNAEMVANLPDNFTEIAQVTFLGIPFMAVIWFIIIILGYLISKYTVFGRNVYAVGSNTECARLSGINVRKTTYGIYVLCALLSAIAGILMTARLGNGVPTGGAGYETDAIAAAVVGGASLSGGEGTIIGTVLGAIIIQTIRQGGNLLGVNSFILDIIVGIFLIIAVLLDKMKKK